MKTIKFLHTLENWSIKTKANRSGMLIDFQEVSEVPAVGDTILMTGNRPEVITKVVDRGDDCYLIITDGDYESFYYVFVN